MMALINREVRKILGHNNNTENNTQFFQIGFRLLERTWSGKFKPLLLYTAFFKPAQRSAPAPAALGCCALLSAPLTPSQSRSALT